jgi:hypothetical protein
LRYPKPYCTVRRKAVNTVLKSVQYYSKSVP